MNVCVRILAVSLLLGCHGRSGLKSTEMRDNLQSEKDAAMNQAVMDWLNEAPLQDLRKLKKPFSYDDWFARGQALPHSVDTLIELLEKEDLEHPSGDGMRVAYALGWIGDKRTRGVDALLRALGSKDINLRIEAASALGRQGNASVVPTLEKLLADPKEDVNVRANACISLGRIRDPSAEPLLRQTAQSHDAFLVACAEEALRLMGATPGQAP
jgi:HEAT repeat protein